MCCLQSQCIQAVLSNLLTFVHLYQPLVVKSSWVDLHSWVQLNPIWYSDIINLTIRREWLDSGIVWISDLIDVFRNILPNEEINERHGIRTNFLDYHNLKIKIRELLEWQNRPEHSEPHPRNRPLNVLLNIDSKWVANLYRNIKKGREKIAMNTCYYTAKFLNSSGSRLRNGFWKGLSRYCQER